MRLLRPLICSFWVRVTCKLGSYQPPHLSRVWPGIVIQHLKSPFIPMNSAALIFSCPCLPKIEHLSRVLPVYFEMKCWKQQISQGPLYIQFSEWTIYCQHRLIANELNPWIIESRSFWKTSFVHRNTVQHGSRKWFHAVLARLHRAHCESEPWKYLIWPVHPHWRSPWSHHQRPIWIN